jgi:hypothetical protein
MSIYSLEDLVMAEDNLRPQTTTSFTKQWQGEPYDFPNEYITDPFPIQMQIPLSSYVIDRNERFAERYRKNIASS